jgi:hypothetical protein
LQCLSFLGGHDVSSDEGHPYTAPQWTASVLPGNVVKKPTTGFPVCYTRGAVMHVSAEFHLQRAVNQHGVRVVGKGPDGLKFIAQVNVANDHFSIANVRANTKLSGAVQFFDPFRIRWKVSFDEGTTWIPAGTTENRLYVTLSKPETEPLYETLLDIGCRHATGCADSSTATSAIWHSFQKRNADGTLPGVARKSVDGFGQPDGHTMRYWLEEKDPLNLQLSEKCHELRDLLNPHPVDSRLNGVGTCQAWTELLEDVLKAQGIADVEQVVVTPANGRTYLGAGFLVKTRAFYEACLRNLPVTDLQEMLSTLPTIHGQGTVNPPTGFVNHSLVLVSGTYYDPSYGNGPFTGVNDTEAKHAWERATLGAFVVDCLNNGSTNRTVVPFRSVSLDGEADFKLLAHNRQAAPGI